MAVQIAAFCAFLFYIAAVPVNIALALRISESAEPSTGISIFEGSYALRSAQLRSAKTKKQPHRKKVLAGLDKRAAAHAVLKAGRYLLPRLQLQKLDLRGSICLGDAARTALACGCLHSLEGALSPLAQRRIYLRPNPDFSAGHSDLRLCGMVSVRAGHIILAALIGAWNYLIRRISHGKASD